MQSQQYADLKATIDRNHDAANERWAELLKSQQPVPKNPGGRPTSSMPGRLKLLHPEVERVPVGSEG
jgi:hypothetical protein